MNRKVFSSKEVADIVMKIIGEIEPIGETHTDDARYINLLTLLGTLDVLINEVLDIAPDIYRSEYSIQRAGREVNDWIKEKHELYENSIGGNDE